jgi:hypothetical protein
MNREITTHKVEGQAVDVRIVVCDEPGGGGAPSEYEAVVGGQTWLIPFQKGAASEVGQNGLTNEVLLAIIQDRLEGFQKGPFPSDMNKTALYHVRRALKCLQTRTRERLARGVEGQTKA